MLVERLLFVVKCALRMRAAAMPGGGCPQCPLLGYSPANTYHRRLGVSAPLCPRKNPLLILACDSASTVHRRLPARIARSAERCSFAALRARSRRAGGARRCAPGTLPQYNTHHTHNDVLPSSQNKYTKSFILYQIQNYIVFSEVQH